MRTTHKVSTKLNKDAKAESTNLTIDWDVSQEDLIELASRSIIILWQSRTRRDGKVPDNATMKASDALTRVSAVLTPERMVEAAKSFTPEQRAELMKMLKA